MGALRDDLRHMLEPGVQALGFELVDVELEGRGARATLRVYIDGPQGVGLDDCAKVSRQLSGILDVEDPIKGSYNLEVSSPGLDRPLVRPADFRRFAGETVKLRTYEPFDGRKNFKGRLAEVSDEGVVVEVEEGQRFRLRFEAIERARLVPKF
jgi:ribosome maturation factor RimP